MPAALKKKLPHPSVAPGAAHPPLTPAASCSPLIHPARLPLAQPCQTGAVHHLHASHGGQPACTARGHQGVATSGAAWREALRAHSLMCCRRPCGDLPLSLPAPQPLLLLALSLLLLLCRARGGTWAARRRTPGGIRSTSAPPACRRVLHWGGGVGVYARWLQAGQGLTGAASRMQPGEAPGVAAALPPHPNPPYSTLPSVPLPCTLPAL